MQKLSKPFAAISYIFAAALLAVYFGTEFVPSFFLSTAGRLVLLCMSCGFLWLGGFLLTKRSGNNRPMKINLRIFLALYLLLFATLTLFDPLWGRNGGFVIWNKELFEMYVQNSLNLVPFKTILQYFYRGTINQFVVNIVGNLVCLMPLGILLPLNFEKQRKTGIFLMTCALIVSLHTLQIVPSVRPVSVQVASLPFTVTSLCPAGISICFLVTTPQTEHFLPSVRPGSVQVASFAGRVSSV